MLEGVTRLLLEKLLLVSFRSTVSPRDNRLYQWSAREDDKEEIGPLARQGYTSRTHQKDNA